MGGGGGAEKLFFPGARLPFYRKCDDFYRGCLQGLDLKGAVLSKMRGFLMLYARISIGDAFKGSASRFFFCYVDANLKPKTVSEKVFRGFAANLKPKTFSEKVFGDFAANPSRKRRRSVAEASQRRRRGVAEASIAKNLFGKGFWL